MKFGCVVQLKKWLSTEQQESAHVVYQTFSRRDELVAQEIENLEACFGEEISDVAGRFTGGHVGYVKVLAWFYNSEQIWSSHFLVQEPS